jgi:hypothetical protein
MFQGKSLSLGEADAREARRKNTKRQEKDLTGKWGSCIDGLRVAKMVRSGVPVSLRGRAD